MKMITGEAWRISKTITKGKKINRQFSPFSQENIFFGKTSPISDFLSLRKN